MTVEGYQQEQDIVNRSFPDFRLRYAIDCLQEQADGVTVTVRDVHGRGTHSGAPYSFGPFPPIPARGVVCQNDPEMIIFVVRDGLLAKMTMIASEGSELSGQPGFYMQIGGVIF